MNKSRFAIATSNDKYVFELYRGETDGELILRDGDVTITVIREPANEEIRGKRYRWQYTIFACGPKLDISGYTIFTNRKIFKKIFDRSEDEIQNMINKHGLAHVVKDLKRQILRRGRTRFVPVWVAHLYKSE